MNKNIKILYRLSLIVIVVVLSFCSGVFVSASNRAGFENSGNPTDQLKPADYTFPVEYGHPAQPVIFDQTGEISMLTMGSSSPDMQFTKTVKIVTDTYHDGVISPGDILLYTLTIKNKGTVYASGVRIYDTPDSNTSIVRNSITTSKGTIKQGNATGSKQIEVSIGTLNASKSATVTFKVAVSSSIRVTQISNQATATGTNFTTLKSDDPGTPLTADATKTKIYLVNGNRDIPGVPGISTWGFGILIVLLGCSLIIVNRRKNPYLYK